MPSLFGKKNLRKKCQKGTMSVLGREMITNQCYIIYKHDGRIIKALYYKMKLWFIRRYL